MVAGQRLGPYEILGKLGEGGMGEVYRARDTKLGRDVALKILPATFAEDDERLARFEREAKTLASLNHPHIAQVYGFEDGPAEAGPHNRALVMELVEGEDLSARIARGPIPLDDALSIARQIAQALEAAHDAGIIHRDLKPANIKLRGDGTVKVLDFGLAKASAAGGAGGALDSPTMTSPAMTAAGLILGTAAYMAPEQAKGKPVDKRADIWAFGCVLYEMLTGQRPFGGDDISDVLAAVLRQEIDWRVLPTTIPPGLRRLMERCLDRDPKTRLRDIGEARVEIAAIERGAPAVAGGSIPIAPSPRGRERLAWIGVGAMTLVTLASLGLAWSRLAAAPAAAPAVMRFAFVAPEHLTTEDPGGDDIIVSPDGTKLVFTARSNGGRRQLWVRSIDALDARALPDTEDAIEPFWSPDSRAVGFAVAGKLKRIDLAGTRAQTLTDAARLNGGASWSRAGVIVFKPNYGAGLFQVSATGEGAATKLRETGGGVWFLPDGRHFVYNTGAGTMAEGSVAVGSLDSTDDVLLPGVTNRVFYAANPAGSPALPGGATGWLVFVKNAELLAQPFDATRLALAGDAVRVQTEAVASMHLSTQRRFVSVSDTGVMVQLASQSRDYQMQWVDRSGAQVGTLGPVTQTYVQSMPSLSPDGRRVLLQWTDPKIGVPNIWTADVARGSFDRVTTSATQKPVWSFDGRHIYFSTRTGNSRIFRVPIGGGEEQLVVDGTVFPEGVSPDGRVLFFIQRGPSTRWDIWTASIGNGSRPAASGTPRPLLNSVFDEYAARISPDGRWLAYVSDLSGSDEVYVRRFNAEDGTLGDPTRISVGGGTRPKWRRDGAELYYLRSPDGGLRVQMMAVSVDTKGAAIQIGATNPLFATRMLPNADFTDYDVTADGQRFLVGAVLDAPTATRPIAVIVLNWMAGLTK